MTHTGVRRSGCGEAERVPEADRIDGRARAAVAGSAAAGRRARRGRERRGLILLALAVLVIGCWSLTLGDLHPGMAEMWEAVRGRGNPTTVFVVRELRIPRFVCAVGVGAALGVGGAIFQALTRNPLATPDLLGVTSGAGCAVALAVLGCGWTGVTLAPIAMVGALLATAFLYGFAWRSGISGQMLVLVGIGVAALTSAVTSYLLTTRPALETQQVLFWLTGSVSGSRWSDARLALTAIVLLALCFPLLRRWMPVLELDDGTARALGVRVQTARLTVVTLAAALAALAVAVAGPIGFLGLVAAPVARGVTGRAGFSAGGAALAGALIVLVADLVGAHLLGELAVPVGVVAAGVGAPYLMYLLVRSGRRGGRP